MFRSEAGERDPWLGDHVIGGMPILPGVVGVELLVQAASELLPGRRFAVLENLRLHRAVKLLRNRAEQGVVSHVSTSSGLF